MSNVVSSWSTQENLQKQFLTREHCGKFVNLWAKTFFVFVLFLRLPEVCGKLANILSVDLFLENTSALCPWQ